MILPKFDYHGPSTIDEACRFMAELGQDARLLAGGTDLVTNMRRGVVSPKHVVSMSRLAELREISVVNGRMRLGACANVAGLAASEEIKRDFEALRSGAEHLGSPLIRNLATVGGNLVSARPAADLPPSLMAYGAKALIRNAEGERAVDLAHFFKGPGETVMAPDDILTGILLDRPPTYSGAAYIKLGARKALAVSIVNSAAFLALDGPDGPISSARVVLGAVAPVPMRAGAAERVLVGRKPTDSLLNEAAEAAAEESRPIDDFRGSADYRRAMAAVMARRALSMALDQAKKNNRPGS